MFTKMMCYEDGHCSSDWSRTVKNWNSPQDQKELVFKKPEKIIEATESTDQDLSPKKALGQKDFTRVLLKPQKEVAVFIFKLFQSTEKDRTVPNPFSGASTTLILNL